MANRFLTPLDRIVFGLCFRATPFLQYPCLYIFYLLTSIYIYDIRPNPSKHGTRRVGPSRIDNACLTDSNLVDHTSPRCPLYIVLRRSALGVVFSLVFVHLVLRSLVINHFVNQLS
jgi:hypothetical protein